MTDITEVATLSLYSKLKLAFIVETIFLKKYS
jgi:hypothetical protein